ncbi:FecR family protein [Pedobacter africanus]|uniref:FecR family protein n=1 Tax=Pedobacter africanus TaxID=151894 RepID=A0A1W1ZKL2_9SPHI|nr:FecR family protein [Pedobacter africanus]SMC48601.1 FecR family protein [Pedobacter africanus]
MYQWEVKKAQRIIYLVTADQKSTLSESEKQELENWVKSDPENLALFNELKSAAKKDKALEVMRGYNVDAAFGNLKTKIATDHRNRKNKQYFLWGAAAAAVIAVVSIAGYFYSPAYHRGNEIAESLIAAKTIAAGRNRATLTLADGRSVELSGDKHGLIMKANELVYDDGTAVMNEGKTEAKQLRKTSDQYATLRTPKGGQYQIVLSDGTKVWLNAASEITYLPAFEKGERMVKLTGEAYFEVATQYISPSKKKPFIVKTATQQVEVLGTHFNICGYPDETSIRTTLMEGAVRVSRQGTFNTRLLKPNQQSIIENSHEDIKVLQVDPAYVIDWKNGDFIFDKDIRTIMRQISRWYNIEVAYEGEVTKEEFTGRILRSKNLAEVLNVLQKTNKVHFRIEDIATSGQTKRVVVMP